MGNCALPHKGRPAATRPEFPCIYNGNANDKVLCRSGIGIREGFTGRWGRHRKSRGTALSHISTRKTAQVGPVH